VMELGEKGQERVAFIIRAYMYSSEREVGLHVLFRHGVRSVIYSAGERKVGGKVWKRSEDPARD